MQSRRTFNTAFEQITALHGIHFKNNTFPTYDFRRVAGSSLRVWAQARLDGHSSLALLRATVAQVRTLK